jgi:hypothetical protein
MSRTPQEEQGIRVMRSVFMIVILTFGSVISTGGRVFHAVHGYVMPLVRIPFDLYPIMLQRWNRGRVWRVLGRPAHAIQSHLK